MAQREPVCPRCKEPARRQPRDPAKGASSGYCAGCQRQRREERSARAPLAPTRRRGQTFVPEPGLKADQTWFTNYVEHRLPIQQITLDVERSVDVAWTFYKRHEFLAFMKGGLGRLDAEEVRQLIAETEEGGKRDGRNTQKPAASPGVGAGQRQRTAPREPAPAGSARRATARDRPAG